MAKRKNVIDSDDDAPESSQVSKRARTEDSDTEDSDELVHVPASRKPVINGKGKTKAEEPDSDEEDEEEDLQHDDQPNEEEEKKFEEDHGEAIRRKLELRRSTIGVRTFTSAVGIRLTWSAQEYCGTWYHRVCRDEAVHVPPPLDLHIRPTGQFHHW